MTKEQTKQIEVIQKRALKIIFNINCSDYKFFLPNPSADISRSSERFMQSFFKKNVLDQASYLHYLLPPHVLLRTTVYDRHVSFSH